MGGRRGGQFPVPDQASVLLLWIFFFEHGPASTFFSKYPTLLSTFQESGTVRIGTRDRVSGVFFPCAGCALALISNRTVKNGGPENQAECVIRGRRITPEDVQ